MADVSAMVAALKAKQQAALGQTSSNEPVIPPYDFGQLRPVEATSGLPIIPGSPYGPPAPISPSSQFGVKHTLEQLTPTNAIPGFIGNVGEGLLGMLKGITHLGGMIAHDALKGVTALIPGEQGLDRDGWKTIDQFLVPMTGWGDAESVLIKDWKYRYGLDKFAKGDILGGLGAIGRGIYEQPMSLVNDALMVGGAIGLGAKTAAKAGEAAYAAEVSRAAEAASLAGQAAPVIERSNYLQRMMRISSLEPSETLGTLKRAEFIRAVGPNNITFTTKLPVNPVARAMRRAVYNNPIVARTFGSMENALKAASGGLSFDDLQNLVDRSTNNSVDSILLERVGDIPNPDLTKQLFNTMKRLVEENADMTGARRAYIKAFRPRIENLYESKAFQKIISAKTATSVSRRKEVEGVFEQFEKDGYEAAKRWTDNPDLTKEQFYELQNNKAQGQATDSALGALASHEEALAVKGQTPRTPTPPPAEYLDITPNGLPPSAESATRYSFKNIVTPIREAVIYDNPVKRALFERQRFMRMAVREMEIVTTEGARKVISPLVDTIDDIYPMIEKIRAKTNATLEWVHDTLNSDINALTPNQKLNRNVIARMTTPDGQVFEIAPMTADMRQVSEATSKITRDILEYQERYNEYMNDPTNKYGGTVGFHKEGIRRAELEMAKAKQAKSPRIEVIKAIEGRLDEAKRAYQKALDEAAAIQDEMKAARAFAQRMNDGVEQLVAFGEDYNPIRKLNNRIDAAWMNLVINPEVGPGAHGAMSYTTMMNRAFAVQRMEKSIITVEHIGETLYDFMEGNLVPKIMSMTDDERLALTRRGQFTATVNNAIMSKNQALLEKFFEYIPGGTKRQYHNVLANQITAFLDLHDFPSAAVEELVGRFLAAVKEDYKGQPYEGATRADVWKALQSHKIKKELLGEAAENPVGFLNKEAQLRGSFLWNADGTANTAAMASMLKEFVYEKLGHYFEHGEVDGFKWQDFYDDWVVAKGQNSPIYYPHIPMNSPKRSMGNPGTLAQIHPREVWLRQWDGELLKQGIYEKGFVEAYGDKAAAIIKHQEIAQMVEDIKPFSRVVDRREMQLWEANKFPSEVLWNPKLVDTTFSLAAQARESIFRLVNRGLSVDEATKIMLKQLMPDAIVGALQNTTGELMAVPRHLADQIQKAVRLNMPWNIRFFFDSPTQVWRASVLAFSPRWLVNNLLGNTYMQLLKNPKALAETIRMTLDPEYRAMWEHFSGGAFPEGVDRGLFFEQTNLLKQGKYGYAEIAAPDLVAQTRKVMGSAPVKRLSRAADFSRNLQGIIEDSFRRGSYAAEYKAALKASIMEHGGEWLKGKAMLEKIMEKGIDDEAIVSRAIHQVNRTLGDYTNLSSFERNIVRRFAMPFYSFYKHAVKYALSFPFEHPYKAGIMRYLDTLDREFEGELPDFMRGATMIGHIAEGDPLFLRTKNWNPLEGVIPGPTGLFAQLHPILRMLTEQMMGVSTMTGDRFTSADMFTTPTGKTYRYIRNDAGQVIGVQPTEDSPRPSWLKQIAEMFPQYTLLKEGLIDPALGQSGVEYGTGGVIMENGQPKYPRPFYTAWAGYFGLPVTTFDPNDYLAKQYQDYWETGVPMAQNRVNKELGVEF
jgi:hypothetical protein